MFFNVGIDLELTGVKSALKLGMSRGFDTGFGLLNKLEEGGVTSSTTLTTSSDFLMPDLLFFEFESLSYPGSDSPDSFFFDSPAIRTGTFAAPSVMENTSFIICVAA